MLITILDKNGGKSIKKLFPTPASISILILTLNECYQYPNFKEVQGSKMFKKNRLP